MENRITKKLDSHISLFKSDIKDWFSTNNSDISGTCTQSDFLKFIFDYDNLSLSKDDFQKRKRVKNTIPTQIRCCAKRANGEQCTRRKKSDQDFCGTHCKGIPYGKIDNNKITENFIKQKKIWIQDIKGIQYYIDDEGNVYNHQDVLANKLNPQIITTYTRDKINNLYNIPEYQL